MYNNLKKTVADAIANENSIDNYLSTKLNLNLNGIIFKPLRFKKINKIPKNFNVILYLLIPFYFVILFISSVFFKFKFKENKNPCLNNNHIFIIFSDKSATIHQENCCELPIIDLRKKNNSKLKYISYSEVFYCLTYSILILPYAYKKTKIINLFNLIHIYELVTFYMILKKMEDLGVEYISHSNHYDRWATIISSCAFFKVSIFQHGIIDENFKPYILINNVIALYSYDTKSEKYFLDNVLQTNSLCNITKKRIKNSSILIDENECCFALIVGHPSYINDDAYIFNELKKLNVGTIIYRPHPISRRSNEINVFDNLSLEDNIVPSHKIALVKESTLGYELEKLGTNVYWWENKEKIITLLKERFVLGKL